MAVIYAVSCLERIRCILMVVVPSAPAVSAALDHIVPFVCCASWHVHAHQRRGGGGGEQNIDAVWRSIHAMRHGSRESLDRSKASQPFEPLTLALLAPCFKLSLAALKICPPEDVVPCLQASV